MSQAKPISFYQHRLRFHRWKGLFPLFIFFSSFQDYPLSFCLHSCWELREAEISDVYWGEVMTYNIRTNGEIWDVSLDAKQVVIGSRVNQVKKQV